MKRLVYAPKAYAYIKNSDNVIHDVTPYIVSGSVTRKIDQVSSATLELRNPNRIFTNPHKGVVFTPMDPITIFLQRLQHKPVQVFTGFLDKTPYYQMYPGTITLQASCTLKKLLYSFFDLGLPYTQAFLSKYGWIRNADGTVMNVQGMDNPNNAPQGTGKGVLIIGDSLSVGSDSPLRKELKNYTITTVAKVGEHTSQGVQDLQNRAGNLPGTVVVALGTNDDPSQIGEYRNQLNKIVNIVGPDRHLIFVNVSSSNEDFEEFNKVISDIVSNNSNASLVDWNQIVSDRNISLTDGIHPDNSGYDKRAQAIADVIIGDNSSSAQKGDDLSSLDPLTDNQATAAASGITDLLIATLVEIANWKENRIYIENLPSDLPQRMANLYNSMAADNKAATKEFENLMENMIGTGSLGSGGANPGSIPSTGEVKNEDKIVQTMYDISNKYHIPPEMTIATWLIEWPSLQDSANNPHYGYFQWDSKSGPPGSYQGAGVTQSKPNGCYDLGFATDSYCQAAVGYASKDSSLRQNTLEWTMRIQGVNGSNNPLYPQTWTSKIAQARGLISKYVKSNSSTNTPDKTTSAQKSGSDQSNNKSNSRLNNMKAAADAITAKDYPYAYGGGHNQDFAPSQGPSSESGGPTVIGYDCSGAVCAVLHAAGYSLSPMTAGQLMSWGDPGPGQVTIFANSGHTFMSIDGRFFGTSDGNMGNPNQKNGGAGWLPDPPSKQYLDGFTQRHPRGLDGPANLDLSFLNGGGGGSGSNNSGSLSSDDVLSTANAAAFAATLEVPSMMDSIESQALAGQKSLMNDKPLMPFIQQMTQASLRSFMSLPNGDFFAFYPDYFGELNHHPPYWLIDDLEVLDGGIDLTDDNLVTHMYVVGNTVNPLGDGVQLANDLMSSGVVNIFNAFGSNIVGSSDNNTDGQAMPNLVGVKHLMRKDQAIAFLQRYGARPVLEEMPMIKNHFYEMFLAYQKFMQGWSRQFQTPFSFTFMPEIFPGGKVGFPNHSLQMFVEEVTHTFDYTNGFFTDATLSSPSLWQSEKDHTRNADLLPQNMVEAILTPAMIDPSSIPDKPQTPKPVTSTPSSIPTWSWGQKEVNKSWGSLGTGIKP